MNAKTIIEEPQVGLILKEILGEEYTVNEFWVNATWDMVIRGNSSDEIIVIDGESYHLHNFFYEGKSLKLLYVPDDHSITIAEIKLAV